MIPVFLDDTTDPRAPRESGWYIMDGQRILEEGPFTSREQAALWLDSTEPEPPSDIP
ncbi:hypothetical protein GOB93_06135 [Acetobacter musti]|uniref:Uncharacterized protein n=1 Tax=Acetobacter musti TaxID=864732 RepID=A0ABX0JN84_9PROT|nr:hypothetical protein [Acetobacter musti]NHN84223.1 hypothetical protein [Acetobacter musti]